MMVPLWDRGRAEYTTPLTPVFRGEVNTSSVGMLAIYV